MRMWTLAMTVAVTAAGSLASGCAGEPTTPAVTPPPAPAVPDAAEPGPLPELAMLSEGPPAELGVQAKVFAALADQYQVGLARCPLNGNGRARQIYGLERDYILEFGALFLTETRVEEEPRWDFLFDEVIAEDGWLLLLAEPGATSAYIVTPNGGIAYTFPPAVAGQVVTCTGVEAFGPRTVRGRVNGSVPANAIVTPCGLGAPTPVAADGTFVVDVRAPCTMWFETAGWRSDKHRIEIGTDPAEIEITFAEDKVLNLDLTWTESGRKMLIERLEAERAGRFTQGHDVIEALKPKFTTDPDQNRTVTRWGAMHAQWGRFLEAATVEARNPTKRVPRQLQMVVPDEAAKAKGPLPRIPPKAQ